MKLLLDIPFKADAPALLASLRIEPGSERAEAIVEAVDAVRPVLRPKAVYDVRYVEGRDDDSVTLDCGVTFNSRVLRVNLDGTQRVFPLVATCGTEVAEAAVECDDLLVKYALDTLMEQALRAAWRHAMDTIKATHSLGDTSAMSPGSLEDWPISQQRELFSVFGDVRGLIGVELSDSFLMVPIKSASCIVFPTEVRFESCQLCPREECPGRRAKYDPSLWEERYGKVDGD